MENHNALQGPVILDTTLRDGEQMPGVVFTLGEKLAIADLLNRAGITEVETGTPAMGNSEINEMGIISSHGFRFNTLSWCRAVKSDIDSAVRAGTNGVHVSFPVSAIHLQAMGKNEQWVFRLLHELIPYALGKFEFVTVGAQDASRTDPCFLQEFIGELIKYPIRRIRIADTVGILNPFSTFDLFSRLHHDFPGTGFEFHGHNDLGMSTANSLAAFKAGAICIDTTINGIGERAGNTPLDEFVLAVKLSLGGNMAIDTAIFSQLAELVSEASGIAIPQNKPITGSGALKHESGIHTNLLLKNRNTYQIISATAIGKQEEEFAFGKHSGSHACITFLERHHIYLPADKRKELVNKFKQEATRLKRNLTDNELLNMAKKVR